MNELNKCLCPPYHSSRGLKAALGIRFMHWTVRGASKQCGLTEIEVKNAIRFWRPKVIMNLAVRLWEKRLDELERKKLIALGEKKW
ncbi:MAG: hypothetical protein KGN01_06895 [Patescibacteria group bacterium]|nr:hypothetical protein [Patescibacteria group bacterium]